MRTFKIPSVLLLFFVLFSTGLSAQDDVGFALTGDVANGEALFNQNCKACHAVHKKLIGPALKGVPAKRTKDWTYKWIRNSQALVKAGDADAVAIYEKFNGTLMTAFEYLSDQEIDDILTYVESVPEPVEEVAITDSATGGGDSGVSSVALLIVCIVLALLVLFLLGFIARNLETQLKLKAEQGEIDPDNLEEIGGGGFSFNIPPIHKVGLTLTVLGLLFCLAYYYGYKEVGIQQGYAPTQPIAFSHKIHAGLHEIECSYCHIGVERGKNATIPAVNICLNCHNPQDGIKIESEEIQKIHAAVDNDRPIEWIRIHNLPDLAYFNHYQHYKIAGIKCQKCHGPIEEMEVVQQKTRLTMGWCINCHRETEVNIDNEYYQLVHEKKIAEYEAMGREKGLTISDLGGMECSKCHY